MSSDNPTVHARGIRGDWHIEGFTVRDSCRPDHLKDQNGCVHVWLDDRPVVTLRVLGSDLNGDGLHTSWCEAYADSREELLSTLETLIAACRKLLL
jgi:hypothetical protein